MHINIKPCLLTLLLATAAIPVCAKQPVSLYSPEAQVLCDKYICATATVKIKHLDRRQPDILDGAIGAEGIQFNPVPRLQHIIRGKLYPGDQPQERVFKDQ